MIKQIFSHSLIYGLAPQVPRVAGFLILPLITPYLTADDYGVYGIVTGYTTMLASLSVLGLNVILSNSFFKHRDHIRVIWGQIYGFLYLWNIAFALLLFIILYLVVPDSVGDNKLTIVLLNVAPLVFFGQTKTIGENYYQFSKQPLQIGVRSAIIGSIAVLLYYYFIVTLRIGYMGFFWAAFVSAMLYNISYFIPLHFKEHIRPIFNFKRRFIRNSLKISLPLVPHAFGAYLNKSSDRVVMERLGIGETQIGNYSFANNFSDVFVMIAQATNTAVSPFMLQNYKDNNNQKNKYIIFIWMTGFLALASLCSLWLREVFEIMVHNDQLKVLYPIGILLIMAICYRPMYVGGMQKLFYEEKTSLIFRVTLTAGLVNILLNIILIPIYGYIAAVYTTYFSFLIQGYILYLMPQLRKFQQVDFKPWSWLIVQLSLTVLVYTLRDASIWVKLLVSVVLISTAALMVLHYNQKLARAKGN